MTRWNRLLWMLFVVLAAAARPAHAQVAQAELRGTVLDESGAALPGVTVTAMHVDTGTARTAVTTATGAFLMPALPVGRYRLEAALTGFATVVQENLVLAVGQSAVVTFTLKVAAVQETVTVAGASPLIETKKSELSAATPRT